MRISGPIIFTLLWWVRVFVPSLAAFGMWVSSGNHIMLGVFAGVAILDLMMARRTSNVIETELKQARVAEGSALDRKFSWNPKNVFATSSALAAYFAIVAAPIALVGYFGSAGSGAREGWSYDVRFYLFGLQLVLVLAVQSFFSERLILKVFSSTNEEKMPYGFGDLSPFFSLPNLVSLLWPESRRERAKVSLLAIWISLLFVPIAAVFLAFFRGAVTDGIEAEQILPMIGIALLFQLLSATYFCLMGFLRRYALIVLTRKS